MSTACDESSRSIESLHRRWAILSLGSFQSGQMELTVNQLSEDFGGSNPSLPTQKACPCGAAVAHSLGKTGVMGSIPITGSRGF